MANENDSQWEDSYTEESEQMSSFDDDEEKAGTYQEEESFDDDYEAGDNEEDDDSSQQPSSNKKGLIIIIIILVIILLLAGIFLLTKLSGNGKNSDGDSSKNSMPVVEVSDGDLVSEFGNAFFSENGDNSANSNMMSVGFNDSGEVPQSENKAEEKSDSSSTNNITSEGNKKEDDLFEIGLDNNKNTNQQKKEDVLSENSQTKQNKIEDKKDNEKKDEFDDLNDGISFENPNNSIVVALNRPVRQNPFKPPVIKKNVDDKYETYGDVQFEIIEPPTTLTPDKNLEKLLQTQISGILYDEDSPSAIVKLAGVDQFVKIGDIISGYKIKNITKTKVEISYKNNTYVASVGELFVPGKLEAQPAVANLNNKFAGRYKNDEKLEE